MQKVAFVLLAGAICLAGRTASGGDQPEVKSERLRETVRKAIESKSVPFDKPALGKQDASVTLRMGGPRPQHGGPLSPLSYAVRDQFTLELLRKEQAQLAARVPGVAWDDAFTKAQEVIDQQLAVVNGPAGGAKARAKLDELHRQYVGVFTAAIGQAPGVNRVTVAVPKDVLRYKVTIKLDPEPGLRFYLSKLDYDILREAGKLDDDTNWNEAGTDPVTLGGEFHFRGRWGDSYRDTGVVPIVSDGPITVSRGR
jgi:hypothetical protein